MTASGGRNRFAGERLSLRHQPSLSRQPPPGLDSGVKTSDDRPFWRAVLRHNGAQSRLKLRMRQIRCNV